MKHSLQNVKFFALYQAIGKVLHTMRLSLQNANNFHSALYQSAQPIIHTAPTLKFSEHYIDALPSSISSIPRNFSYSLLKVGNGAGGVWVGIFMLAVSIHQFATSSLKLFKSKPAPGPMLPSDSYYRQIDVVIQGVSLFNAAAFIMKSATGDTLHPPNAASLFYEKVYRVTTALLGIFVTRHLIEKIKKSSIALAHSRNDQEKRYWHQRKLMLGMQLGSYSSGTVWAGAELASMAFTSKAWSYLSGGSLVASFVFMFMWFWYKSSLKKNIPKVTQKSDF